LQINVLEASIDGGPALTTGNTDDAGIHLRRFYTWTNAQQAQSDLATMSFSDGGDRSALANILTQEGGTLICLFSGLQNNIGAVESDIEIAEIND